MVTALGLVWVAIIGGAAVALRPVPSRRLPVRAGTSRDRSGSTAMMVPLIGAVSALRRRQIAFAVPAMLVGGLVWLPLAALAGLGAWALPIRSARTNRRALREQIRRELPDVIDLFVLGASVGLNLRLAVEAVAEFGRGLIARELGVALERSNQGVPLSHELSGVISRLGDDVRPLVRVLSAVDLSAGETQTQLEVIGLDARLERRRTAEIEARRIPVRLLFPLVLCVLPAFGLLTVVPILVGSFQSFAV